MKKILVGVLTLASLSSLASLSPLHQSVKELKIVLSEATSNLNEFEIVRALGSRGGKIIFMKDEIGYSLQSTASEICILRFKITYPAINMDRPISGARPFSVRRNTVSDVIWPMH